MWKKLSFALLVSCAVCLLLASCVASLAEKPAPDFQVTTYNNQLVRLIDYKNKGLVLIFYWGDT